MNAKIDSKEKISHIRQFINALKQNKQAANFIFFTNATDTGCFDFEFITRRRLSFSEIQKKLKENKYETILNLADDLRQFFIAFSDYLLSDDPLQEQLASIIRQITTYESTFAENFRQIKPTKVEASKLKKQEKDKTQKDKDKEKEKNAPEYKKSTLLDKIEMCFHLKANEDNIEYVRRIGESYGIGKETDDYYIIKLQNQSQPCQWLQLLQKKLG